MLVKPRHVEEVIAIKLETDLIAEHGNVLIVRGDETVEVITEEEFDRIFEVKSNGESEKKPDIRSPVAPPMKRIPPVSPSRPTATRIRHSSEERIILAFGPDTNGHYLTDLSVGKLAEILERMPTATLLDRLYRLTKNKHIAGNIESGQVVYSLTELGKEVSIGLREKRRKH